MRTFQQHVFRFCVKLTFLVKFRQLFMVDTRIGEVRFCVGDFLVFFCQLQRLFFNGRSDFFIEKGKFSF